MQSHPSRRRFSDAVTYAPPSRRVSGNGVRVGPGGRYVLGQVLAYGGFSTIREVVDLGERPDRPDRPDVSVLRTALPFSLPTLAGKLVYSDEHGFGIGGTQPQAKAPGVGDEWMSEEMALWCALPTSRHILPLIWHERIRLDPTNPGPLGKDAATRVDVLIMPLCDAGSLLDYVRHEGVPKPLVASHAVSGRGSSVSRHTSIASPTLSTVPQARPSPSRTPSLRNKSTGLVVQIPETPITEYERRAASDAMFSAATGAYRSSINCDLPSARSSFSGSGSRTTSLRRVGSVASGPRSRGLPLAVARDVLSQVTEGLRMLHAARIVHNDLKLDNILGMMSDAESGEDPESLPIVWQISDFGLATTVDSTATQPDPPPTDTDHLYSVGKRLLARGGSMPYCAPELLCNTDENKTSDGGSVDMSRAYAADMWALGCVLYALLSGRLPFRDQFEPRLQAKIQKGEWEMPARLQRRAKPLGSTTGLGMSGWPSSLGQSSAGLSLARARKQLQRSDSWGARVASKGAGHSRNLSGGNITMPSPLSQLPVENLSASTPALPPSMARRATESLGSSAPPWAGEADDSLREEDVDSEPDPISDEEKDEEELRWSGTSGERASARQVLRGLLELDPERRWNMEQLLQSPWLGPAPGQELHLSPTSPRELRHPPQGNLTLLRPTSPQDAPPQKAHVTPEEDVPPLLPGAKSTVEEEFVARSAARASRDSLPFLGFVSHKDPHDLPMAAPWAEASAAQAEGTTSGTHTPLEIRRPKPTPATPAQSQSLVVQTGWPEALAGLGMPSFLDEPRGRAAVRGRVQSVDSGSASRSRSRFRPATAGVDRHAASRRSLSRSRTRADEALASLLDGTQPRWSSSDTQADHPADETSRTHPPLKEDETLILPPSHA